MPPTRDHVRRVDVAQYSAQPVLSRKAHDCVTTPDQACQEPCRIEAASVTIRAFTMSCPDWHLRRTRTKAGPPSGSRVTTELHQCLDSDPGGQPPTN
jgi:hypothetical protein